MVNPYAQFGTFGSAPFFSPSQLDANGRIPRSRGPRVARYTVYVAGNGQTYNIRPVQTAERAAEIQQYITASGRVPPGYVVMPDGIPYMLPPGVTASSPVINAPPGLAQMQTPSASAADMSEPAEVVEEGGITGTHILIGAVALGAALFLLR